MRPKYYLAVDIGASSGRHILGSVEDEKLVLEEIYRFDNGASLKDGTLCWDIENLVHEVKNGLKKCAELGKIPVSVGIDTWAVDYLLVDGEGRRVSDSVSYRDGRTQGMDAEVSKYILPEALYSRAGIQKQPFNTIYQLMAQKLQRPDEMEKADKLLMMPDYLHYTLCGIPSNEYTNATSTQLVSAESKDWDWELIDLLGYDRRLFQPLRLPGTELGPLTPEVAAEIGFNTRVVIPATHDTASAIMAVGAQEEHFIYISSGTWSIMGTEVMEAVATESARLQNFTNEGGYDYRFRFSSNITGLWMIQSIRRELGKKHSYDELCEMAKACSDFPSLVDVNDGRFFAPDSMIQAVKDCCLETGQPVPESIGELCSVVYRSLADCYRRTADNIESLTGMKYDKIYVVGGGCRETYLNELTAGATGRTVTAGPSEATATGNIVAQMISGGEIPSLAEARRLISRSFETETYLPKK